MTLAQSIVPSSGSVTVMLNGTVSPKEKSRPLPGLFTVTVGAVLPTVMVTLALPVAPCGSRTVSVAVYVPFAVYVLAGLAAVEVVPSPNAHA
ncbi:hypothetical protein C5N14_25410 [Micromonospora sp. MW-13]|nr:hypothetical protein C5N14_25410 [Micromonospora sp. MW-13]